jgi:hypothetical protein
VVVYVSPHEDGKQEFINGLHLVMDNWNRPTLVGGDLNIVELKMRRIMG